MVIRRLLQKTNKSIQIVSQVIEKIQIKKWNDQKIILGYRNIEILDYIMYLYQFNDKSETTIILRVFKDCCNLLVITEPVKIILRCQFMQVISRYTFFQAIFPIRDSINQKEWLRDISSLKKQIPEQNESIMHW